MGYVNKHYEHADPRYGFEFGASRVTRMAHIEGRYHVMAVDTPYRHVQVATSPTGRSVRIWIDGEEVGLPGDIDRWRCECGAKSNARPAGAQEDEGKR